LKPIRNPRIATIVCEYDIVNIKGASSAARTSVELDAYEIIVYGYNLTITPVARIDPIA
jgi:hypothetical protein